MALVSSGIYRVRAYALSAGVFADGSNINEPLSIVVSWQSEHIDKLYQVYVDGRLGAVTGDFQQREVTVSINSSWNRVVRIEVYAVEPGGADIDHSDEMENAYGNRVELSWVRSMELAGGGGVEVFGDGGSGEIDLSQSLEIIDIWPVWQDKGGFGLCCFGSSDFGYDGSAAVGFGRGFFGGGEFGFDAEEMEWVSEELAAGEYLVGVRVSDSDGNIGADLCQAGPVLLNPLPEGGIDLEAQSYDQANNSIVFNVS